MDNNKELEPMPEGASQVEAPVMGSEKPAASPEVEGWMEKIEKKFARVPNQTSDKNDDTVVIDDPGSSQPPITLPINQQQMQAGKKAKIEEGIAWLVAWAMRQIKMLTRLGRKVKLQDLPEAK